MLNTGNFGRHLPVIAAGVRNIVIIIAVLSIPLTAAQAMELSAAETSAWILALYGVSSLLGFILTLWYRQPLLATGNLFIILFASGLGGRIGYPELVGASILAGVGVLSVAVLGLTQELAALVPVPIMFGLLAGAVLPFVSRFFSVLGEAPWVVGGTLLAYLLSRQFPGNRLPAILTALVAGVGITAVTGQFGQVTEPLALTWPAIALPVFSIPAILTATPVFIVLITLQADLPSVRFLQSQGYEPPEFVINAASGIGTILGSFLGPLGVSLSLAATSLVAGPDAGEPDIRHRSVYITSGAGILVGALAGLAIGLVGIVPIALLWTLAGLAVLNVLGHALERITKGPLLLGPLFALAIALSDMSFLGFDSYFLVTGHRDGNLDVARTGRSAPATGRGARPGWDG